MAVEEITWLAGLFDGEGHVSVLTKLSQRAFGVKIQITNTCHPLLDRVAEITGIGYISTRPRQNERWKTTYDWHTTGGNAKAILQLMLPYLIVKREAALRATAVHLDP